MSVTTTNREVASNNQHSWVNNLAIRPIDFTLLLLLGALWGGSYLFIRIAGPFFGPVVIMALRVSLAAITLIGYTVLFATFPDFRQRWKQFLLLGLLNNAIPFTLIAVSVINLNASIAAILNATTPLFTAIVAAIWVGEAFGGRRAIGVILGIVGVAVLMGWSPLPLTTQSLWAAGAALLAALSYGIAAVYARQKFQGVAPIHTAIGQLSGSSLILLPFAAVSIPTTLPSSLVIWSVIGLAVACTAIAYLIYFRLIASAGATQAATVTFLVPFFSVLWGVVWLDEPLNLGIFMGLGIILTSVWLVLGKKS